MLKKLEYPLKDIKYKNADSIEFKEADTSLSFSYESLPPHLLIKSPSEMKELNREDQKFIENLGLNEITNFRILRSFILSNKDKKLDIFQLLPQEYKIYFNPYNQEKRSFAGEEFMVIKGDFAKPSTLLALFHEVGHLLDLNRMNEETKEKYLLARKNYTDIIYKLTVARKKSQNIPQEHIMEKTLAVVINSERNAWALGLQLLRPFFKGIGIEKDDAKMFIHDYILSHGYSQQMLQLIEEGYVV